MSMVKTSLVAALAASMAYSASAECANACNGHGRCTSFDMCICNRNWQANDCSERVCQYGLAHVDTPKGDLDMSGDISGPDTLVTENSFRYPFGTTEQFPMMKDTDQGDLTHSAHYYMECSNKGECNRETGECECYPGYDGAACQRASCPGYPASCSGHGVCKTIRQLAESDGSNVYELWDRDVTMGCDCDPGFSGPDCSLRECKYGVDPLYLDDTSTIQYPTYNFGILTTSATIDFDDGTPQGGTAQFAIRFYDAHGEDWVTSPLDIGATCETVIDAINKLPNDVIGTDLVHSTMCTLVSASNTSPDAAGWSSTADSMYSGRTLSFPMAFTHGVTTQDSHTASLNELSGYVYNIHFYETPGNLKQPEIVTYLDGTRSSINTASGQNLYTSVWTNGQRGETKDYFGDHCDGVEFTVDASNTIQGLTAAEISLLKACLGDSDGDATNNVDVENWDVGDATHPHLVKIVPSSASVSDGGYYAAIAYVSSEFEILNNFNGLNGDASTLYQIYTTKGTMRRVSSTHYTTYDFADNSLEIFAAGGQTEEKGDLACETVSRNADVSATYCVEKGDIILIMGDDTADKTENPTALNLYGVEKIYRRDLKDLQTDGYTPYIIKTDISTNWAHDGTNHHIYRFIPSDDSTYEVVAQCSNRGLCNEAEGICECFGGYTGDSCSDQNSLSV